MGRNSLSLALTVSVLMLSACATPANSPSVSSTSRRTPNASATTTGSAVTGFATTVTSPGAVNPAAIPLGDGYLSSSPKGNYSAARSGDGGDPGPTVVEHA